MTNRGAFGDVKLKKMHAALSLWLKVGIFMKKYHKFQRHLRSCQSFRNWFVRYFLRVFVNRIFSSLSVRGYRNFVKTTQTFCKLGICTSPHSDVTWYCIIRWVIAAHSVRCKVEKMHAALSLWLKVGILMKKISNFQRHLFVRHFLRVFVNRIFSSLFARGYRNCVKTTETFCKLGIRTSPHCNVTWHCIIRWLIAEHSVM